MHTVSYTFTPVRNLRVEQWCSGNIYIITLSDLGALLADELCGPWTVLGETDEPAMRTAAQILATAPTADDIEGE